jgi:hypothetical protein
VVVKLLDTIKGLVGDQDREQLESYATVGTRCLYD